VLWVLLSLPTVAVAVFVLAESSSSSDDSSDDSDLELVSEGEDGVKRGSKARGKQQQDSNQPKQQQEAKQQGAGVSEGGAACKDPEMAKAEAAALEALRK
jgi:hypothetical protein